jgi:hypothetical protein
VRLSDDGGMTKYFKGDKNCLFDYRMAPRVVSLVKRETVLVRREETD